MTRVFSALATALALLASAPAIANEFCDKEIQPLVVQRKALSERLAAIGKRPKEPGAKDKFCGTLTSFIGNGQKLLNYMEQNKDFCAIPDQTVAQVKAGLAQNQTLRRKICLASAQPQPGAPGKPALPRPPVELKLQ